MISLNGLGKINEVVNILLYFIESIISTLDKKCFDNYMFLTFNVLIKLL
jgi:hypothetical protein